MTREQFITNLLLLGYTYSEKEERIVGKISRLNIENKRFIKGKSNTAFFMYIEGKLGDIRVKGVDHLSGDFYERILQAIREVEHHGTKSSS